MHSVGQHNSTDSDTISNANLSPAQAQVIAALACGQSVTAAAREAGLHRSTIYNWLQHEPQFKTAVESAQREYVEILNDGVRDLAADALRTLRELLNDPNTPPAVRLRTALAILQRPHFPAQGWNLPESIELPHRQRILDGLADIKADYDAGRMTDAIEERAKQKESADSPPTARSAPCPCGSGVKYKRCCGSGSPGKITTPRAAA
jgi:transposase-like protein